MANATTATAPVPLRREAILAELAVESGNGLLAVEPTRVGPVSKSGEPPAPTTVAVVPVYGALKPAELLQIRNRVSRAAADSNVGAIVLHIDSPGGTVAGTPETAAAVASAARQKRVIAVADTLAASAAYWIASQAGEIAVTPSGDVGSIGVIAAHMDLSKLLSDFGIAVTLITSGKYKGEFNPFGPLSDESKAYMQQLVDETHGDFVRAVAEGRKTSQQTVRESFGQGRVFDARRALKAGMVDRIATLDDVVADASARMRARSRRSAAAFY